MTTTKNNHSPSETILHDDKSCVSKCILYENFIDEKMSAELFTNLLTTLPFEWTHYTVDGNTIKSPRRMVWMTSFKNPINLVVIMIAVYHLMTLQKRYFKLRKRLNIYCIQNSTQCW